MSLLATRLSALAVAGLIGAWACSCGGTGKTASSSSEVASIARHPVSPANGAAAVAFVSRGFRNDGDSDAAETNDPQAGRGYHDSDDGSFVSAAHEAQTGDVLAAAAVVKRYYAALASGDGRRACSMISPKLAESVAEDYGLAPGPSYLRGGKSCPEVIALLSKHFHARLANPVTVAGVRITGDSAFVILRSKTPPLSDLNLQRLKGAWRFDELIGNHDVDDRALVAAAKATQTKEVLAAAAVVERYYAALAAGDGQGACSMIAPKLAESVAEDYGRAPGPSYLRGGKSCPAVIGLLSKHFHARLANPVTVTAMGIHGNGALALLGSKSLPASNFNLERIGGVWKADAMIGDILF